MFQFPVATVANWHKVRGLKQHPFILSQFWKPKVQNQVVNRGAFFLDALGRICFLSLPVLVAANILWLMVTLLRSMLSPLCVYKAHLSSVIRTHQGFQLHLFMLYYYYYFSFTHFKYNLTLFFTVS